jgi:hypothetical protein
MTLKVFAWPPVGVIGTSWAESAPVEISRSMTTGAERLSAFQRKRTLVRLTVPGIGRSTYESGYMEVLKRYLEGIHLVRLYSYPINWHLDQPQPLVVRGDVYNDLGRSYVVLRGLPRSRLIARPGEFLTLFLPSGTTTDLDPLAWQNGDDPLTWNVDDSTNADPLTWFNGTPYGGTVVQVIAPAMSDDTGRAVVAIFETVPDQTQITVLYGACDTGAFRPETYPTAQQPQAGNWSYEWSFREVFADEVGGFVEINPWSST